MSAFAVHERESESAIRLELIVSTAEQSHIVDGRFAATSHGHDMVELETVSRVAAPAAVADERAAIAIAFRDRTPNAGWDVAGVR